MPIAVVLAVGLDSLELASQKPLWNSAGFIVVPASTIRDAIDHFKTGDFDLVLLGNSLSIENKERLTFLIRKSGSHTPIVCIGNSPVDSHSFADATLRSELADLLAGIRDLLAKQPGFPLHLRAAYREAS
jgi:hypothetical protein